MFKLTGRSGFRAGSGGARTARVEAKVMGNVAPRVFIPVPAFMEVDPIYHGFDSSSRNSRRLQGLEKRIPGNPG